MIKPAAEGGGQPIRGRGVALERGVAGTGPASGGVRGEALPSEALQAPLGRTARGRYGESVNRQNNRTKAIHTR